MELSERNTVPEQENTEESTVYNDNQMQEIILSTLNGRPTDRRDEIVLYLQQDNIRLEQELRLAHDRLEYYSRELSSKTKLNQILEDKLSNATEQNNNLLTELNRYEAARALAESQTGDARRVIALQERLAELEQNSREMREQLFEELRISEAKLLEAEEKINQSEERILHLERTTNDWRKKYEEMLQENEALLRANEEVKSLEIAIGEVKDEKQMLYQKLNELLEEKRQLLASRDHLSNHVSATESKNAKLQAKIRQMNESFNENVTRLVDKENFIKNLSIRIDKLSEEVESERLIRTRLEEQNQCLKDQIASIPLPTFDVVANANEVRANKSDTASGIDISAGDDNSTFPLVSVVKSNTEYSLLQPLTGLIKNNCSYTESASICSKPVHSSPSFLSNALRFKRFVHFLPHRRRSLKPFVRYILVAYITVMHVLLLKYVLL